MDRKIWITDIFHWITNWAITWAKGFSASLQQVFDDIELSGIGTVPKMGLLKVALSLTLIFSCNTEKWPENEDWIDQVDTNEEKDEMVLVRKAEYQKMFNKMVENETKILRLEIDKKLLLKEKEQWLLENKHLTLENKSISKELDEKKNQLVMLRQIYGPTISFLIPQEMDIKGELPKGVLWIKLIVWYDESWNPLGATTHIVLSSDVKTTKKAMELIMETIHMINGSWTNYDMRDYEQPTNINGDSWSFGSTDTIQTWSIFAFKK